ncbi:type II secretion system F family protein [Alkalicoccus chagannorensis]|uniref:type II secretion system F family protein n=1 Tax=Alkalicoccus chagannorensis TaxID=427072 RepID=UPI00042961FA|nr:type II secretion system F family protein [Alkalicoccus chagannorensis]
MPFYHYYGRDAYGVPVEGKMRGATEKEVRGKLEKKAVHAKEVKQLEGWLYQDVPVLQRQNPKEMVLFLRQLATLLQAGITLVESIKLLAGQMQSRQWRDTLAAVEEDIRGGTAFSAAAEKHRNLFPPLMTNMIKAGEAGGDLDEVIERLAVYYEKQYRLRQKVLSSLSYPLILAGASMAVVIFLLAVVVPTFADMFAGFQAELPWITRFVLTLGNVVSSLWWLLFPLAAAGIAAAALIRSRREYLYWWHYVLLRTPIVGGVLQKAAIARMSRTWSSLFASSVPVLQAVSIVERVVGNEVLATVIRDSRKSLEKGESLADPMNGHWIFPPMVTQMVTVGEKTGSLDQMFDKIADFYEEEVDQATDRMKSMMEPVLISVLAVVVGVIVASVAVPMFEIFDTIE